MVEAALAIGRDGQARRLNEPLHLRRQRRIPGRGIAQLIGVRGKAIIVVKHARLRVDADRWLVLLPMRGDDQERLRPLGQRFENASEIVLQAVPCMRAEGRRPVHPEAWTAAVRHEKGGLAGIGHGNKPWTRSRRLVVNRPRPEQQRQGFSEIGARLRFESLLRIPRNAHG